jgi:hypothetical protein
METDEGDFLLSLGDGSLKLEFNFQKGSDWETLLRGPCWNISLFKYSVRKELAHIIPKNEHGYRLMFMTMRNALEEGTAVISGAPATFDAELRQQCMLHMLDVCINTDSVIFT